MKLLLLLRMDSIGVEDVGGMVVLDSIGEVDVYGVVACGFAYWSSGWMLVVWWLWILLQKWMSPVMRFDFCWSCGSGCWWYHGFGFHGNRSGQCRWCGFTYWC